MRFPFFVNAASKNETELDAEFCGSGRNFVPPRNPLHNDTLQRSGDVNFGWPGNLLGGDGSACCERQRSLSCSGRKAPPVRGVYFFERFQHNLAQAILAGDAARFARTLNKYVECSKMGRVIYSSSDSKFFVFSHDGEFNDNSNPSLALSKYSIFDRVVDCPTKYTLMHLAVAFGTPEFVRICLEFGSAVHSHEDANGMTALTLALLLQPEMAFEMLERGQNVDISRVDTKGRNLLFYAVTVVAETPRWPQRLEFIKNILAHDDSLASARDYFGFTPATWALEHAKYFDCKEECYSIVNFLKHMDEKNKKKKGGRIEKKYVLEETYLEDKSFWEKQREEQETVHSERFLSDLLRLIFQGPTARLCCIVLLFMLHMIVYSSEKADRGLEAQYRNARWDFWFTIYNAITLSWNGATFYMRMVRVFCILFGAIIGALVYFFGVHVLLGRTIMRLPMCGAQSIAEKKFMKNVFDDGPVHRYAASCRGMSFALVLGVLLGIYSGAKVYNELLYRFWPERASMALILSTIAGLDTVTALRAFWVSSIFLDWYIFMFVCDIMYQQGTLNIYLPHHTFGSFAAEINAVLRRLNKRLVEGDIFVLRLRLYWGLFFFGLSLIAFVFIFLEFFVAPAKLLFVSPLFSIGFPYLPAFFSSICILLECVILCQEWTWPTFQKHPFLNFPGLAISSHHVWFLMFVMLFEVTLDLRVITAHIGLMYGATNAAAPSKHVVFSMALVPALLGLCLLVATVLRSSLWWEVCGRAGRAVQPYTEHLRLRPAPLQSDEAVLLSGRAAEELGLQLSRALACTTTTARRGGACGGTCGCFCGRGKVAHLG